MEKEKSENYILFEGENEYNSYKKKDTICNVYLILVYMCPCYFGLHNLYYSIFLNFSM